MTDKRYTAEEILAHAKWASQSADYLGFPAILGEIAAMLRQAAEDCEDAERYHAMRELCGYVQNGSDTSFTIFQDDATRDWCCRVGRNSYYGPSFKAVIDTARTQEKANG